MIKKPEQRGKHLAKPTLTIEKEASITGHQLTAIREFVKMDRAKFARLLGYVGSEQTLATQIYRLEGGQREINARVALLCLAILDNWRPMCMWNEDDDVHVSRDRIRWRRKEILGHAD